MKIAPVNFRQLFYRNTMAGIFALVAMLVFVAGLVIAKFTHDQTYLNWQTYGKIFASEVKYQLILNSESGVENIAANFTDRKDVIAANVYDSNGRQVNRKRTSRLCREDQDTGYANLFPSRRDVFCIRQPIIQTVNQESGAVTQDKIGEIELIVSKQGNATLMLKIWLAFLLLAVSVLFGAFRIVTRQSYFMTATIEQMIAALQNFKENRPNNRVSFSGSDDLDQMRETFNDMLASIERNEEILEQAVILKTKELNQALAGSQSANRYKANIMSTVSHEMKNPLHSIQTGIDLLFEGIPEDTPDYASYQEHHYRAKMLVQELVRHIDAILINAKLNANEYKKSYTLIHLDDFMDERRISCQHLCCKNGNNLVMEGERGINVLIDHLLLWYIVGNLLENACKFTKNGHITLRWRIHQDTLVIEVEDTGCGMSQPDIGIIFDEFRQIDMSLTRRYRGFGLGLSISRQSAQLLGGDIKVTSQVGKGSLFQVTIPKNGQDPSSANINDE